MSIVLALVLAFSSAATGIDYPAYEQPEPTNWGIWRPRPTVDDDIVVPILP